VGEAVTRQDNVQGEEGIVRRNQAEDRSCRGRECGVPGSLATQVQAMGSAVPRSAGFKSGSVLASVLLLSRALPDPNRVVSPNRVPPTTEQETWRSERLTS